MPCWCKGLEQNGKDISYQFFSVLDSRIHVSHCKKIERHVLSGPPSNCQRNDNISLSPPNQISCSYLRQQAFICIPPWIMLEYWLGGLKLWVGTHRQSGWSMVQLSFPGTSWPMKVSWSSKTSMRRMSWWRDFFFTHSLALKMNVKSWRDVSRRCRFSCFPLCLTWMRSASETCTMN